MRWILLLGAFAPLILAWILLRQHKLSWAPGDRKRRSWRVPQDQARVGPGVVDAGVQAVAADQGVVGALELARAGEVVVCSREQNRELFDVVRCGLSQFGLITRAKVRLRRCQPGIGLPDRSPRGGDLTPRCCSPPSRRQFLGGPC